MSSITTDTRARSVNCRLGRRSASFKVQRISVSKISLSICAINVSDPAFDGSCRLFDWNHDSIYAEWTPQEGATLYRIDYGNNATVVTTNETLHTITGLRHGQRYIVTVSALDAANSTTNNFTCSVETGDGIVNAFWGFHFNSVLALLLAVQSVVYRSKLSSDCKHYREK